MTVVALGDALPVELAEFLLVVLPLALLLALALAVPLVEVPVADDDTVPVLVPDDAVIVAVVDIVEPETEEVMVVRVLPALVETEAAVDEAEAEAELEAEAEAETEALLLAPALTEERMSNWGV